MYNFPKIFFIFFASMTFLSAQSRPDFDLRVENSFAKLYENPDVAIHAAKEIRNENHPLVVKDILAKAYLLKGDYIESVRTAFENLDLPNSDEHLLRNLMIAREFYHLNLYEQTSKIIRPLLSERKMSKIAGNNDNLYAQLFQLQAKNYIALKQLNRAEKSLSKSSDFAKTAGNSADLILKENELLTVAILSEKSHRKEAQKAADKLLNSLEKLPRAVYLRSATEQFRGRLFFEEQQYEKAIECLKRALAPLENTAYEPLKNGIYADLTKNYLVIKKDHEYDFYKNKLDESSKLLTENKKEARRELIQLNTEFTAENAKVAAQKKKMQFFFLAGIALLFLGVAGFLYAREAQKATILARQIKFFRSINIPQTVRRPAIKEKDASKKALLIPKETEKEILDKLEQFEESKNYLDNNMSLANLSAQLGTNTKYLSEIINKYKDKNFNTYINELRVKHVIQLLATDRSYLQYKISYIAEIGGFTSHSAFTNVFKTITGMSPQEYMQTLRNS